MRRAPVVLRKTKEHRRNDARGVFRRAIVTRCSDVHRATGANVRLLLADAGSLSILLLI